MFHVFVGKKSYHVNLYLFPCGQPVVTVVFLGPNALALVGYRFVRQPDSADHMKWLTSNRKENPLDISFFFYYSFFFSF